MDVMCWSKKATQPSLGVSFHIVVEQNMRGRLPDCSRKVLANLSHYNRSVCVQILSQAKMKAVYRYDVLGHAEGTSSLSCVSHNKPEKCSSIAKNVKKKLRKNERTRTEGIRKYSTKEEDMPAYLCSSNANNDTTLFCLFK